jgi:hypothetical protein
VIWRGFLDGLQRNEKERFVAEMKVREREGVI